MEKHESSSEQYKTSGLDMRETLDWYKNSGVEMPPFSEMDFSHPVENQELIELSERLTGSLNHGHLREILVRADSGFVILQFINKEYMLFHSICYRHLIEPSYFY